VLYANTLGVDIETYIMTGTPEYNKSQMKVRKHTVPRIVNDHLDTYCGAGLPRKGAWAFCILGDRLK
jgi:hypothetical protein